jgi:DNA-binding NtrC family response regulator
MDGLTVCRELKTRVTVTAPVIFVSAREDSKAIVSAFEVGAVDYVTKPLQEREVLARVRTHLNSARLQRELESKNSELLATNTRLTEQIRRREQAEAELDLADQKLSTLSEVEAERWGLAGFVGTSSVAREICEEVRRLHDFCKTNVLITGESGSGKELIARAIHVGGARRAAPFVPVNCSAIPEELAESIFFGHQKGAFTGAIAERKGYFELAHGGTLFLDEVGDLPRVLQAKLLRTLEDGSLTPIGSQAARRVDVRVISATNADLVRDVREGAFRQDLYFRLAQYAVAVPPLRERNRDIPLLVSHFLNHFAEQMRRPAPSVDARAMAQLVEYAYPGNVRELRNIVERALILSGGREIKSHHLKLDSGIVPQGLEEPVHAAPSVTFNVEAVKAQLVDAALERSHGNVSAAARLLGVHRSWFYRRR